MDKKVFIGLWAFVALMFSVAVVGAVYYANKEDNVSQVVLTDGEKFRLEFERYNDVLNESSGKTYLPVTIDPNNNFQFKNEQDVLNILNEGTGIIYFAYGSCTWCRSMLPPLMQAIKDTGAKNVYYLNISDVRSSLDLSDDNKVVTLKKGTQGYYSLLNALDSVLEEYTLSYKDEKGKTKTVKTGEKRILAPTLVFVRDGKIVSSHVGTVSSQEDPYVPLTDKEFEKLYNTFVKNIEKVYPAK